MPDITEQEATGAVGFLKEDRVTGDGLTDTALDVVQRFVVDRERFPDERFSFFDYAHERTRTGEGVVLGDLVVGVVRKECEVRTAATASQASGGGEIHP